MFQCGSPRLPCCYSGFFSCFLYCFLLCCSQIFHLPNQWALREDAQSKPGGNAQGRHSVWFSNDWLVWLKPDERLWLTEHTNFETIISVAQEAFSYKSLGLCLGNCNWKGIRWAEVISTDMTFLFGSHPQPSHSTCISAWLLLIRESQTRLMNPYCLRKSSREYRRWVSVEAQIAKVHFEIILFFLGGGTQGLVHTR